MNPFPIDGPAWDELDIVILPSGEPAVVYQCDTSLKYSWREGGVWETSTITSAGWYVSLALLPSGQPAVSYVADSSTVKYAWFDGWSWNETALPSSNPAWTSLAILPSGEPAIAHKQQYEYDLRYAWYDGSGWQTTIADGTGDEGSACSLALGPLGEPAIAYQDRTNFDLRYAWRTGGTWQAITVDGPGEIGAGSLAFLPDETRRRSATLTAPIAGRSMLGRTGASGRRRSSTWKAPAATCLKLWHGCPAIVYQCGTAGTRFAWLEDGTWHREIIDPTRHGRPRLAILPNGQPAVLYQGHNQLHYAEARRVRSRRPQLRRRDRLQGHQPVVLALSSWGMYQQTYRSCNIMLADMNTDGFVTFGDINPFVAALSGN